MTLPTCKVTLRLKDDNGTVSLLLKIWLFLTHWLSWLIAFGARIGHWRQGARFAERLGHTTQPAPHKPVIWFHAASLGEISQVQDVILGLQKSERYQVLVTTMTSSGANFAARHLPQATHQFVPLDTPSAVEKFLGFWNPQIAIFVESDLWPRLIRETAKRDCPLILLNARPSKSRERAPQFYGQILAQFDAITCKSAQVADGLIRLGITGEKLFEFGDLRANAALLSVSDIEVATLRNAIGDRPVWIAASTHVGDEAEVLAACKIVLAQHPKTLLIWAPRHPNRGGAIQTALTRTELSSARRSQINPISPDTQVYIADTLGELGTLIQLSNIVFLGGSFGKDGGHNPYEPARFATAILTGPNVKNHSDGFHMLVQNGAGIRVSNGDVLGQRICGLLNDGTAADMGQRAKDLVDKAQGATTQTIDLIEKKLRP